MLKLVAAFGGMLIIGVLTCPGQASAQTVRPSPVLELATGYAGFVDDETIDHFVLGGAVRFYVTDCLSVGPEVVYMMGPASDRDLVLTGNLLFDFFRSSAGGAPINPYIVVGGGLFRHSDVFWNGKYSSTEGAFTGGGGVRISLTRRTFVAPELRLGWELHYRFSVALGVRFRDR